MGRLSLGKPRSQAGGQGERGGLVCAGCVLGESCFICRYVFKGDTLRAAGVNYPWEPERRGRRPRELHPGAWSWIAAYFPTEM